MVVYAPAQIISAPAQLITAPAQPPATGAGACSSYLSKWFLALKSYTQGIRERFPIMYSSSHAKRTEMDGKCFTSFWWPIELIFKIWDFLHSNHHYVNFLRNVYIRYEYLHLCIRKKNFSSNRLWEQCSYRTCYVTDIQNHIFQNFCIACFIRILIIIELSKILKQDEQSSDNRCVLWRIACVLVFESSFNWHTLLFLMLFCSNSAHFSEIQLCVTDRSTDG